MATRAALVDVDALTAAQEAGDVLGANEIFMDAFYTDVRPRLAQWRIENGLPANPMTAFAESGYQDTINAERVGGTQSSWGA
jgi:L-rhamnose isomerase / sugar isomerase